MNYRDKILLLKMLRNLFVSASKCDKDAADLRRISRAVQNSIKGFSALSLADLAMLEKDLEDLADAIELKQNQNKPGDN
ncbi:MAG: hypothetical protein IH984_07440 [Planctomycetes bacterium]|nr:hypothetical protein [Planctomycetota bacterium]